MSEQVAFPWWNESRKRRQYRCEWFDLLSAYAAVQKRFEAKQRALALADRGE